MIRYLITIFIFLSAQFGFVQNLRAQQRSNMISTITIKSTNNMPIEGASVWYKEGSPILKTNKSGQVKINLKKAGALLRIVAKGYDTRVLPKDSISAHSEINLTLSKTNQQENESDLVELPFGQLEKRRVVGAIGVLKSEEILKYDNNQDILKAINGRVSGMYGSRNIRGLGTAIIVIDGIPRSASDNSDRLNMVSDINLLEVKEITVLKDVTSRMLYGAKADQGVILITTKRGTPFKRDIKVYAETGLSNPVSYPDYLSASDYMTLYNEALSNDGLAPKYSNIEIAKTRDHSDPIRYPDESFYNNKYLKDNAIFYSAMAEASGGDENTQYFASVGFRRNGSLFKPQGEDNTSSIKHLNFRGNVDLKINNWISASIDAIAIYHYNRYPNGYYGNSYNGNFFGFAANQLPNSYPVLIPADKVHDSVILKSAKLIHGQYLLGGTNQFGNNVSGNLNFGGMQSTQQKSIQFNTGLKFDLSSLLKGFTANVNFTYDFLNSYTLRQENTYSVYEPSYVASSSGEVDSLIVTQYGTDVKQNNQTVNGNYFQRRYGIFGTLNYKHIFDGANKLDITTLAYMNAYTTGASNASDLTNIKDQHFGLRINYLLKDKYVAEFDGVYVGSSYLSSANRYAFSPSIGLGWIISEEKFLKDKSFINFLKLKSSYGILNTDNDYNNYRLYNTSFNLGGNFSYNGLSGNGNRVTQFRFIGNPDLGFVKNKELNIGFEASIVGNKIGLEFNYFDIRTIGIPVVRSSAYESYIGGFIPRENYNENKTSGVEALVHYTNKINKFEYRISGNMVYTVPMSIRVDEIAHEYEYQYNQGRVSDAIFGLVAEGLFKDQADIDAHAVQLFGSVQPGDIKYKDLNNDGVINEDDRQQIGNGNARFQYALDINLKYKNFELFVLGTARTGNNVFYNNNYYWVSGNNKYSEVVLNRWTPETAATATYPRLTTQSGSNNFQNSTFWLYKRNYLTLNRLQLTYHLPASKNWKGIQIYAQAENLFTISPTSKQQQLNIGSSPQMRNYMLGIVGSF